MQEKKLLYIGNKFSTKVGTVTSIDTLGNFLTNEGYKVYTASKAPNKLIRLLDMIWHTFRYAPKVSCVLIDTYSTQNFYYAVVVAGICRLLKLPYIPILHGGKLPQRLKKSPRLCRKLFNDAKINVSPSLFLLETFKKQGYTNLIHIPNTLDIDRYKFKLRNDLQPSLLWVRSFSEIYNPQLALEIVAILQQKGIAVNLCMVGPEKDGSLEACRKAATEAQLPVTFTGGLPKEQWIEMASKYDIFINTAQIDNTPVSVMEAMALGLAVVSTRVGGIPYLIEDRQQGLLVPPNDAQAFVAAIEELLTSPQLVTTVTKNARDRVATFDWKSVKNQWIALLDK